MATLLDNDKRDEILNNAAPQLLQRIQISPMLMVYLVQRGVISHEESRDLQALQLPSKRKQALLTHLYAASIPQFVDFCLILNDEQHRADIVEDVLGLDINQLRAYRAWAQSTGRAPEEPARRTHSETSDPVKDIFGLDIDQIRARMAAAESTSRTQEEPATRTHKVTSDLTYEDVDNLISEHKGSFFSRLDVSIMLRAALKAANVITDDTEDELSASNILPSGKVEIILETVRARGVGTFLDFCHVLCRYHQEHMVTEVMGLKVAHIEAQRARLKRL